MKLVVGLGNPGRRYRDTRHNVGFRVVDRVAERHGVTLQPSGLEGNAARARIAGADGDPIEVALFAPTTFMNLSGEAVVEAVDAFDVDPESELLVVYDDVDLPFGRLRLRPSGGAGGHNGLASVLEWLQTRAVARLRFGVGRSVGGTDTRDWVLESFGPEETAGLPAQIDAAADAVECFLCDGITVAMNRFNAAPTDGESG